jgi:hypothetical protein
MILNHMPSILSTTLCMKEGLIYLMVTLPYHLPKIVLTGCDEICVEICTLGGVSHVLLSSLAHVGRIRHFVPSTFVYFHFDFG